MTIMNVKSNGKETKLKVPPDSIHIIEGRLAIPFEAGEYGFRGYFCGDYPDDFKYVLNKTSIKMHLFGWRGVQPLDLIRIINKVFNDVEISYAGGGVLVISGAWPEDILAGERPLAGVMVIAEDLYINLQPKS